MSPAGSERRGNADRRQVVSGAEDPDERGRLCRCLRADTRKPVTFEEAFCARYRCPAARFPDRAFRLCLYSHAVPLALVLRKLSPSFFREDFQLIQQVGLDQDLEEVDAALSDFQYVNRARRHWLRTGLKIRLSGRKVRALAGDLLGPDRTTKSG